MPLFDFYNKDEVEYAFLDGRYKLQRFNPIDELVNEKIFAFKVLAEKKQISLTFDSEIKYCKINSDQKILDKVISIRKKDLDEICAYKDASCQSSRPIQLLKDLRKIIF